MNNLLFICMFSSAFLYVSPLQCMDEDNKPVDWFIVYKLPEIKHHHKLLKAGVAYTYMTSDDHASWKFSKKSINATDSIIANTLQRLYDNKESISYILYNDEPPNRRASSRKGHNKGVVMSDDKSGLWLVHSVPKFPQLGHTYIYPRTGAVFGQTFLCISMDLRNLDKVGIQLQHNQPEIYSENVNSNLKIALPNLSKAAANITIDADPFYHVATVTSLKGIQFITFAKSKDFSKDLYEDLVAPSLKTDLYVETWPNGPGRLPSNCSKPFKVNNVELVYIDSADVSFTTTHDHAKWAVSPASASNNWMCIGDINRAEHQKERGGGTVCLDNKQVAHNFQRSVKTIEKCEFILSTTPNYLLRYYYGFEELFTEYIKLVFSMFQLNFVI